MPGVVYTFSFQITNPAAAQVPPSLRRRLPAGGRREGFAHSHICSAPLPDWREHVAAWQSREQFEERARARAPSRSATGPPAFGTPGRGLHLGSGSGSCGAVAACQGGREGDGQSTAPPKGPADWGEPTKLERAKPLVLARRWEGGSSLWRGSLRLR